MCMGEGRLYYIGKIAKACNLDDYITELCPELIGVFLTHLFTPSVMLSPWWAGHLSLCPEFLLIELKFQNSLTVWGKYIYGKYSK